MLANFSLVAAQVGTLFLIMGVGYVLAKLGKFSQETRAHTTTLLLYLVVPCLIIDTLQIPRSPHLMKAMGQCAVVTFGLYFLLALLDSLPFRGQPDQIRPVMRYGAMYGNTGFMGLPLVQAVLGDGGMVFAIVGQVGFNLFAWSHGVTIMGGRNRISAKKILCNPGMIGSAAGVILFLLDLRLPTVLADAVSYLGSMNTPLAMVIIGAQMAEADLAVTFRNTRLYLVALLKLIAVPLLTALMLRPLKLDPVMYTAIVILMSTPSAGYTSIFAQQFQRDTAVAAQLVTLTTACCILTLPCFGMLAAVWAG